MSQTTFPLPDSFEGYTQQNNWAISPIVAEPNLDYPMWRCRAIHIPTGRTFEVLTIDRHRVVDFIDKIIYEHRKDLP